MVRLGILLAIISSLLVGTPTFAQGTATVYRSGPTLPTSCNANTSYIFYLTTGTTGTYSSYAGTAVCNWALVIANPIPNGTTATTQGVGDNTNKLATDAFVLANETPTGPRTIYAANFGVFADGKYSCWAGIANTSHTVTTDPGTSTVTQDSISSNVATITSAQFYQIGDSVTISGTSNNSGVFNGTFTITAISSGTSFSFPLTGANFGPTGDAGTVTGPSVDAPFVNATIANGGDIGDIVFGTNMYCADENGFDFSSDTNILPLGTITAVNGPHSITVSNAATGTCAGSVNTGVSCQLGWFRHDDTAALQNFFNSLLSVSNGISACGAGILPAGNMYFSAPIVNQTSRCGVQVDLAGSPLGNGFSIIGAGPGQSVLIPSPALDASTAIPKGIGADILFGSTYVENVNFWNFGINGLGNDQITNGNNKCILVIGWNSSVQNVNITNWGNRDNQTNTGLCADAALGAGQNYISNFTSNNGAARCVQLANETSTFGLQCLTFLESEIFQGDVKTSGSYFGCGQTGNYGCVRTFSNVIWRSTNDRIQVPSFEEWCIRNAGIVFAVNLHATCGGNSGNGGGVWLDGSGSTVGIIHLANSQINSTGTGPLFSVNGSTSGTIYDGCGNTVDSGSVASVFTSIIFWPCSTGSGIPGQTIALTGTGACGTITTQTGNGWGGTFKCTGSTGATTVTITPGPTLASPYTGWVCHAYDQTTVADVLIQTSQTTTACVFSSASTATNDVITFSVDHAF